LPGTSSQSCRTWSGRSRTSRISAARKTGHIAVAAVESVAAAILPNVIDLMRARAPGITFYDHRDGIVRHSGRHCRWRRRTLASPSRFGKSHELHQVFLSRFKLGAVVKTRSPSSQQRDGEACPIVSATPSSWRLRICRSPICSNHCCPSGRRLSPPFITCGSIELMQDLVIRKPRDRLPDQGGASNADSPSAPSFTSRSWARGRCGATSASTFGQGASCRRPPTVSCSC